MTFTEGVFQFIGFMGILWWVYCIGYWRGSNHSDEYDEYSEEDKTESASK